jgi:hypothetical protein
MPLAWPALATRRRDVDDPHARWGAAGAAPTRDDTDNGSVTGLGPRLDAALGEPQALELTLQQRSYPELAYTVKHTLTPEVAHSLPTLLHQRRLLPLGVKVSQ